MKSICLDIFPMQTVSLPFAHFQVLQGVFYKLLSSDTLLSSEIHDKLPGKTKQFKFFCFTDLQGKYSIYNKKLFYDAPFRWEIRAADERIINAINQSLLYDNQIDINGAICRVSSFVVSEKTFYDDEIIFKMDTPLLYYLTSQDGRSNYFAPYDSEFIKGIESNIIKKFTAFFGKPPPIPPRFMVAKLTDKSKCVTQYKKSMITAYYGTYKLIASPEVLKFVYYTGLGAKNSMGFGTIKEKEI